MSDNLFFIEPIVKALHDTDVEKALTKAFREIKKKGTQKRFAEGFKNFKLFMDAVYSRHEAVTNNYIHELIAELVTGTFEGTEQEKKVLSDIICLHTEWMVEYLTICRQLDHSGLMQDTFPVIAVLSEKGLVKEITFTKVSGCESISDILPGKYTIKLANTGWIIWEGHLSAEELISSEAPKGENLRLAAGPVPPTKEIDMLDNGDLILRTYAKDKSGRIEIELNCQESFKNE